MHNLTFLYEENGYTVSKLTVHPHVTIVVGQPSGSVAAIVTDIESSEARRRRGVSRHRVLRIRIVDTAQLLVGLLGGGRLKKQCGNDKGKNSFHHDRSF